MSKVYIASKKLHFFWKYFLDIRSFIPKNVYGEILTVLIKFFTMTILNTIFFSIRGIDYLDLKAGDQYRCMRTEFLYPAEKVTIKLCCLIKRHHSQHLVLAGQFTYRAFEQKSLLKFVYRIWPFLDVIIIHPRCTKI